MSTSRERLGAALSIICALLALGFVAGCGGGGQSCSGGERCACYPNGTCNTGLTCLSNVCVDSSSGAGGHAGTPGHGGESGGAAGTGGGSATVAGTGGSATGAGGSVAGSAGTGVGGSLPGTGGAVAGAAGAVAGAAGAVAGTGGGSAGSAGSVAGTGGAAAGSGGSVSGGSSGTAGQGGPGGAAGGACRLFETVPGGSTTVPTVFVLVDRSGSMFGCVGSPIGSPPCADQNNTPWAVLRTGVLSVIQDLQSSVRFGFGAFTGNAAMNQCPLFDQVSTALDNYTAINSLYGPLGAITGKAETPVGSALDRAKAVLDADATTGPKYILFVTDGEPDYCNDGNTICAVDSVVGRLQSLNTSGITTLVFGIQNGATTGVPLPTLQAFANAGASQPVAAVVQAPYDINAISDQCQTTTPWRTDLAAAGKTFARGISVGSYTAASGGATVYQPNPADAKALEALIATTVGGLKSCYFDLVNGLAVDLAKVDQASVSIEKQTIPRDDSNGWRMVNPNRLQLVGTACALWRQPTSRSIDFQFPCGVVTGS